jgi:hypothetical protein
MNFDFRFIEIESELSGLGQFLEKVEPTLAHLIAEDEHRVWKEVDAMGLEANDAFSLARHMLDDRSERVFPGLMRAPFLIALWSCYEWAVLELAEARRVEVGAVIRIDELKNGNILDRAKRYFDAVLGTVFDDDADRLVRLGELYEVRNALAHKGGHQRRMSREHWARMCKILCPHGMDPEEDRGMAGIPAAYLPVAFADVNSSLRALTLRVRGRPVWAPANASFAEG